MSSVLQVRIDRLTTALFSLTLAFTFCGLFLLPNGKTILSNMLVISILAGIVNLVICKSRDVGLHDRRILWLFLGYAAFIQINRLIHGDQYGVMRSLGYVALFGLLVPRKEIVLKVSRYAIMLGGVGMGCISLWQQSQGVYRVEGFTNAILFSQASLVIALLAWGLYTEVSIARWEKAGALLSVLMALYSLYVSQSRGVWLAFMTIVGLMVIVKAIKKPLKYIVFLLLILGSGTAFYHQSSVLQERVQASISDLSNAEKGQYDTSWGLRLVAWQGAWQGFLTSPILGVGTDGFDAVKKSLVASGVSSPLLLNPVLAHSHNQYMQNLIIRGTVGGVALLLFLGWPMWWAVKCWGVSSVGVLLPLSFAIGSVSDVPFEHQNTLLLYALGLLFIWLCGLNDIRGTR
ncbi:O-antigen ligase family protein [Aeromonas veronii]|uniref:O-antigen ligase family protein n=1 Tax=Aeromonas TaxID=642 RepID=UPI00030A5414|nr:MULTISPECIES: O-antigen ligase family protein [Aeromonas]HDN9002101.1 O-antigen ligase family protein [Aeromonas veronii AMC24]KRV63229.1 polymerase [Aeromonas veronii]KRV77929.1 polymerase [Aeromonas veronii]KRV85071.1 polymerase [Aeromonas veronii]KRV88791.1 polymerase [Aeromonas veronii]